MLNYTLALRVLRIQKYSTVAKFFKKQSSGTSSIPVNYPNNFSSGWQSRFHWNFRRSSRNIGATRVWSAREAPEAAARCSEDTRGHRCTAGACIRCTPIPVRAEVQRGNYCTFLHIWMMLRFIGLSFPGTGSFDSLYPIGARTLGRPPSWRVSFALASTPSCIPRLFRPLPSLSFAPFCTFSVFLAPFRTFRNRLQPWYPSQPSRFSQEVLSWQISLYSRFYAPMAMASTMTSMGLPRSAIILLFSRGTGSLFSHPFPLLRVAGSSD